MNQRPRLFYGWVIVALSAVGLFLGAPIVVFSFGVFFKPMVADFHASRAAVSLAFSLANTAGALSIPCIGMAIDRFGAKRRHRCVDLLLRRGSVRRFVGGRQSVAALSFLCAAECCDDGGCRTRSLRRRDFTLVQSLSWTCAGTGDDGHRHWLGGRSDCCGAADCDVRVAKRVCDLRGCGAARAASSARCMARERSRATRPST